MLSLRARRIHHGGRQAGDLRVSNVEGWYSVRRRQRRHLCWKPNPSRLTVLLGMPGPFLLMGYGLLSCLILQQASLLSWIRKDPEPHLSSIGWQFFSMGASGEPSQCVCQTCLYVRSVFALWSVSWVLNKETAGADPTLSLAKVPLG